MTPRCQGLDVATIRGLRPPRGGRGRRVGGGVEHRPGFRPKFVLFDPRRGQELYPRCLDVLVGTLEAFPELAFVFPIQEVAGAPDAFVTPAAITC